MTTPTPDIEGLKAEIRNADVYLFVNGHESEAADLLVRALTQKHPDILLPMLCDGEVSLQRLETMISRQCLRALCEGLQIWTNCYFQNWFPIISSGYMSPETQYKDYFFPNLRLLASLERFGIFSTSKSKLGEKKSIVASIVGDEPGLSSKEISEILYIGQEVKFKVLGESIIRLGHVKDIDPWRELGRRTAQVDIEEPDTGNRFLVPAYAILPESYLSEIAKEKRIVFQENLPSSGHLGEITNVIFTADGRFLLSSSIDGMLRYWDVATGNCLQVFQGHTNSITCMALSNDGLYALSGSPDMTVRFWEIATGKCLQVFTGHQDSIAGLDFSSDGKFAISVESTQLEESPPIIRLWDTATGNCRFSYAGHKLKVISIKFLADNKTFISTSVDQSIRVWDVESGACLKVINVNAGVLFGGYLGKILSLADDTICCYAYNQQGRKNVLETWNVKTGQEKTLLEGVFHRHTRMPVFISGSKFILLDWKALTAEIRNITTGDCEHVLVGHRERVKCAAICPDGRYLVTGAKDRQLILWDVESGARLYMFGYRIPDNYSETVQYIEPQNGKVRGIDWDLHEKTLQHRPR
ncbi:WD40 repeat domain-containing protein [Undibacterium sp. Di26W]|uniref:WD40 repeat domain-containing protein n=1 Tax=Undibacterium sp. Di26W TaxID=3413035 RepID=UPI003BF4087D